MAKATGRGAGVEAPQLDLDPVCGRRLGDDRFHCAEYKQRRYYFCSEACRLRFQKRTEWFRLTELARAGALLTPGKVRWGLS